MKRILILLGIFISLVATRLVLAQNPVPTGAVEYEVKINLHRNLPPEREGMKEMVPEFNVTRYLLVFNQNESYYEPIVDEEEEVQDFQAGTGGGGGGGGMRMVFRRPQMQVYTNQAESRRIRRQEFFGKTYLILDTVKVLPWKVTGESKVILGQTCMKATYFNEQRKQQIVAWFSPTGPRSFLGPDTFNGLPGIVLQIDINDGMQVITATKIESRELKKSELKRPTDGETISEADFRKMMEEQMQRMNRGGGRMIIRN